MIEEREVGRFGEDVSDVRERVWAFRRGRTGEKGRAQGNPMRLRVGMVRIVDENSGREKAAIREWRFRNCFRAEVEQFWVMTTLVAEEGMEPSSQSLAVPRIWGYGLMACLYSCHIPCQLAVLHPCV